MGTAKRTYDSARRREAAEQTRARILDAAYELFVEHGFDGASVTAIAERAGVAPETVYARFRTKRALLGELAQRAVRGDDPRPVLEQPGPRALLASRDQREQLALFAADIVTRIERAGPVLAVVDGAGRAHPELAELYERLQSDRLRNLGLVTKALAANGPLAVDAAKALDTLWVLTSPEVHRLLTATRGWSRKRYVAWLVETLAAALLP